MFVKLMVDGEKIGDKKNRDQRVAVFNFGTDRVRVLEKIFRDGSGMDRVQVFASYIQSIGYYRVVKILIEYLSGISIRHIYLRSEIPKNYPIKIFTTR